jgi:RNA polymerase sigma-70 factor (ECF subfamily)
VARPDAMTVLPVGVVAAATGNERALLDERAFLALYARTVNPLRAYLARTLGTSAHVDDILQETYLRLLRTAVPTRSDDELRAYVFRIAGNLAIDYWRTTKHEVPDTVPERGSRSPDAGLRVDIRRLFSRLKARERQRLWLAHVEGADHAEIAAMLGLRRTSIRVLLARARRRFARVLRAHGHGPQEHP